MDVPKTHADRIEGSTKSTGAYLRPTSDIVTCLDVLQELSNAKFLKVGNGDGKAKDYTECAMTCTDLLTMISELINASTNLKNGFAGKNFVTVQYHSSCATFWLASTGSFGDSHFLGICVPATE